MFPTDSSGPSSSKEKEKHGHSAAPAYRNSLGGATSPSSKQLKGLTLYKKRPHAHEGVVSSEEIGPNMQRFDSFFLASYTVEELVNVYSNGSGVC
ncbi:hypothetical protein LR48_Vigan09g167600 [Vigna angularis]|uniref:Uncharacterized protein n=1 Tax=Phaseolus angularis TaxID=3914 RepID=A0A0L9TBV6_PHAAN|nr:hypothetical protein LR48_Vigan477s001900 [Vigna angularis]KOM53017.1 hypothetical protein LR48_Vigan09g167600 [Vigna angularis]